METNSTQEIASSVDNQTEAVIFDQDYWNDEKNQKGSDKSLCDNTTQNIEPFIADKIEHQIKHTQEKFFKAENIEKLEQMENISSVKKIQDLINPNCILRAGFMKKKTDGFFFTWHTRYMLLTPEKLYSFQDEHKAKVIGCVNLKLLPAQIKSHKDGLMLDFKGQCQNMLLKAENKLDQQKWRQQFNMVLQYNSKQNKLALKTMNKFIYQHKDALTQKDFLKEAETGDILLFHTNHVGAKLQRVFTNSDFDHVAMVVRMKKKQLMIFESNQMHGVCVYDWAQYINYFDLYGKVTLRKLNYIRKPEAQNTLLQFMKKNIGKKYDIGLMKLMKLQSDFNWENVNEERGYFCSQLIAKALKSIGLLDQKKSSGRYWPVDFSQKNCLQLKKGAYLGPEQVIVLNKHTKNQI